MSDLENVVATLDRDALTAAVDELATVADRAPADVDADDVAAVLAGLAAVERERHPWRGPDQLARLYYGEGLTQPEVADRLDCGQRTIARWMDRFDLAPRKGRGPVFDGAVDPTADTGDPVTND
jgi:DNA-directed RNA polymerase specialized sigma24 family protein